MALRFGSDPGLRCLGEWLCNIIHGHVGGHWRFSPGTYLDSYPRCLVSVYILCLLFMSHAFWDGLMRVI